MGEHKTATRKQMLIMETWGYSCLMPGAPKFIVEIAFSERAEPGVQDANLVETREAFFSGFRFSAQVDRSSQMSNRNGAVIGGLATVLLGTMLACHDVDEPEAAALLEMEKELIRRMRSEKLVAD